MALPINVDDLIHQRKVERTRIEYKSDWNPEPVIHSVTAFANDFDNMGGGYILIGVEEVNGRPKLPLTGLDPDSIDTIQQDLLNKCNFIEPRCIPVIEPRVAKNVPTNARKRYIQRKVGRRAPKLTIFEKALAHSRQTLGRSKS